MTPYFGRFCHRVTVTISDKHCTRLEVLEVLLRDDGGLSQLAEEADPHVALQAANIHGLLFVSVLRFHQLELVNDR